MILKHSVIRVFANYSFFMGFSASVVRSYGLVKQTTRLSSYWFHNEGIVNLLRTIPIKATDI